MIAGHADYRKGLVFYTSSIEETDRRRSSVCLPQERCDFRRHRLRRGCWQPLSLLDDAGMMDFSHNWLKPGWVNSFAGASFTGT